MLPTSHLAIAAKHTLTTILRKDSFYAFNSVDFRDRDDTMQLETLFKAEVTKRMPVNSRQSHWDKLNILEQLNNEIELDKRIHCHVNRRLKSYVNLEVERIKFAIMMEERNVPILNAMRHPERDCWRLVMDGRFQNSECDAYHCEDEEGYMAGMLRGFNFMLNTIDSPLTPDLYCQLHDQAIGDVYTKSGASIRPGYPQSWLETCFGLKEGVNCTAEGLWEFSQSNKDKDWIRLENSCGLSKVVICRTGGDLRMPANEIIQRGKDKTQMIITAYEKCITKATPIPNYTERETAILTAIATCCQDLDQHHLFSDGNIRTAVFLVMNKLLLQNGLSPTILHDPNVVDMHSVAQIVALIREGQNTFRKLIV